MPRKLAILDTNILQYACDDTFSNATAGLLQAVSQKYDVVTTWYTKFELFRGLSSNRVAKVKAVFSNFTSLTVDEDVFRVAAAISTCYSNDDATKKFIGRYSDGDILIAATAYVNGALILTANVNDFPRPYFKELADQRHDLTSARGRAIRSEMLEPDVG